MNAEETKHQNNQTIEQLKKENRELKKLKDELMANKRAGSNAQTTEKAPYLSVTGEIQDEKYWRRKLDQQKHANQSLKKQLITLQEKLNEVTEAKFGGPDESNNLRNIRILENRLDKVMIKYNEAQSIRKTYEQIVKRLKEERVGYDNQLVAIERSLKGKEHDYEELLLLAHDATHAKELSQAELKKYEHKKEAVKELRKAYLEEKRRGIESREDILSKIQKRDKEPMESDLQIKKEKKAVNNNYDQRLTIDQNIHMEQLNNYEEAMRKIYEATGVTDVNEIIQKFTTQEETTSTLSDLKHKNTKIIEDKDKEIESIKQKLKELKYEGGETLSRKQLDEREKDCNNAATKTERAKMKFERIQRIKVNEKAGVEHIVELLEFFKLNGQANIIPETDESLVEALGQCVEKMKMIYQVVKNDRNFNQIINNQNPEGMNYTMDNYQNLNLMDRELKFKSLQKNNRVRLMDKEDEDLSDGEIDDVIDMDIATKLKSKYEMLNKDRNLKKSKKN